MESHQSDVALSLAPVDSTAISRYINADGERHVAHERARRGRAGSIPGISMPPNHRFSTYRLSPASAPSGPPPLVPSDLTGYPRRDLLPVIIQLRLRRTAQALMAEPHLGSPFAACNYLRLCLSPMTGNVPPEEPPSNTSPGISAFDRARIACPDI